MPQLSRRTSELGTENAFVVLAEVTALVRQGKDIISFCIGQPDFPTPKNVQRSGYPRHRGRQARLHAVGRHRRTARGRGEVHGRHARPRHPSGGRGGRRRREALHRLQHPLHDRLRRGRRGDLSESRLSDLRVADRRQRRGAGAAAPARGARLRLRSGRPRGEDHAAHETADPQFAAQPDRRHPQPPRPRGHRRDPAPPPGHLGLRRRDLLAPGVRRPVRVDRVAARHVRAHHHFRRRVQDLGDDRLAHRLRHRIRSSRRSSCAG